MRTHALLECDSTVLVPAADGCDVVARDTRHALRSGGLASARSSDVEPVARRHATRRVVAAGDDQARTGRLR